MTTLIDMASRNLVLLVRHKKVRSHHCRYNVVQLGLSCSSQEGQVLTTIQEIIVIGTRKPLQLILKSRRP